MTRALLFSILFFFSFPITAFSQDWKAYPYHEENSELFFPADEGWHPDEPIEWWYTNATVTGQTTGNEYSLMLTYFYFPALGFDGFRIFNIANETEDLFFDETRPCLYPSLSQDHLDITASVFGAGTETWTTMADTAGNLLPFQYQISAGGQHGAIDLHYNTLKRPLMVGGTGFLYQGINNYTYYYSQTAVEVTGQLTFDGFTEAVSGIAWIDRQWGNFNPNTGEQYEWFSIQLSNGTDINLWNIFTVQNEIPDTATYRYLSAYVDDATTFTISEFALERLGYVWMPDDQVSYSRQWRLTADAPEIDLLITTRHDDHEVALPFRFYEGATTIEGAFDGQAVTGRGFAELLRHYEHPEVAFLTPNSNDPWDASIPISWQLLDPDDGRPVFYDLEVSDDNKETFTPIATGLTTTEFLWDAAGHAPDSSYWFRLTGRSIDGVLMGTAETKAPHTIFTSTGELFPAGIQVTVFPNPARDHLFIDLAGRIAGKVMVRLTDLTGRTVKAAVFDHADTPFALSVSGIPAGSFFLEVQTREGRVWKKIALL